MKTSITTLMITVALLCTGLFAAVQAQQAAIPFTETFETTFAPGAAFLPYWSGNRMGQEVMGQYSDPMSGNRALYMAPIGEELPTTATLSLNLSTASYNFAYASFSVATRENHNDDGDSDMKRVKLSVSISVNGGPFEYGMKIGPERGFENTNSGYVKYTYPFPPHAYGQSNVKLRFTGKAGGGPCTPVKVLIDNVYVDANPTDVHAPYIVGEVRPASLNTIEIKFGEPVLAAVAENKNNYTFSWPDDHQGVAFTGTMLPRVQRARLANNGYNVLLTLHPGMSRGDYYSMTIQTMQDLYGNAPAEPYQIEELVHNVPAPGDLQITEIFFADPSTAHPKQKLQFVEIYNPTNRIVPIGGLRIKGAISAHNMPNVKLYPGDFYVITRNAAAFYNTFNFPAWEWKGSWIQYPSQQDGHGDETVETQSLFIQTTDHHSAAYVDEVVFNLNNPPWSALVLNGYSMEWCNLNTNNANPYNWALANGGGAPFTYTFGNIHYDIFATPGTGRMGPVACGPNNEKVAVCHQAGNGLIDLCIDPQDVSFHLAHGDRLGGCAGTCDPPPQFRSREGMAEQAPVDGRTLAVTPNPFSNYTFISSPASLGQILQVDIYGIQGKRVKSYNGINQEYFTLSNDGLAPGMYLMTVRTESHSQTVRIIVQ
ncbi:MAG: T9SS type A sorting domain-containing protein [Phaeodactylibacter sp.]|nr:T9SS type A sorting domain-containing protein [Phaeodactylibacter sp.]